MWGDIKYDREIWTEDKVLHLFNSELGPNPRGTKSSYEIFTQMLNNNEIQSEYININCVNKPACPKVKTIQSEEWRIFRSCRRGGGDLHGWLKWWAYNWIASSAYIPPEFEVTFKEYGRVDIYSEKLSIFVECGNTSPDKAITALCNKLCSRFIVLPFQRSAIENTISPCSHKLEAVVFSLAHTTLINNADSQ